jgi:hypothetical protein
MQKKISSKINRCREITLEILDNLLKHEGIKQEDLWKLHGDTQDDETFEIERSLLKALIDLLINANPNMISKQVILTRILYGIIWPILHTPGAKDEILKRLDQYLFELISYVATRVIDIPITNIYVGPEPFKFGQIVFYPINEEDKIEENESWWSKISSIVGSHYVNLQITSYVRVNSAGDIDSSISNAVKLVDDYLLILRALCYPFVEGDTIPQIDTINNYSNKYALPLRLNELVENHKIEFPSTEVTRTGAPIYALNLHRDLLINIDKEILGNIIDFLEKESINPSNKMKKKFISGLRWTGEATKPDILSARFTKLAVALESFIGGDSNVAYLSTRGITATLAERAAFLIGGSIEEKLAIHKKVAALYGKRSKIVHGSSDDLEFKDLKEFSEIIRLVIFSYFNKLDDFNSIDDFQRWILNQRYD